ncbi:Polyadenylate-binding protein 4 [Nowakowskiella sp. JEL0407]|nr:Polyadenylate-binding protein 4 [Nowakowskiella sp. JEL0407]
MADPLDSYPTLYISGLPPSITEFDLVKVLSEMKVESKVIIDRDPVTNVPLGRIRIIFRYQPDAERFFATVNGSMFLGVKVHLTFKDPNMNFSNTSGSKAIVVKHMPLGVTSLEFYDTVRGFGRIISCKVMIDRSGTECYALLQFENQDAADRCMSEMNGAIFNEKTISLSWQFPKNSPYQYPTKNTNPPVAQAQQATQGRTPSPGWQSQNPSSWNQPVLQPGLSWSQQPTPPSTPQWQNQQTHPGHGMTPINNGWQQQPQAPHPALSPQDWNQGTPVSTAWSAAPTGQTLGRNTPVIQSPNWEPTNVDPSLDAKNLYIKNLEEHIDNLELFNMFRKYGRIVSARVMRDDSTGKSKGFGFVSFENDDQAKSALQEMNGRRYGAKNLVVNIAEPKGYREKKLAAAFSSQQA